MEEKEKLYYNELFTALTEGQDGQQPQVMVYAIPSAKKEMDEISKEKGMSLSMSGFVQSIYGENPEDETKNNYKKEIFLDDKYFTSNLMKELSSEKSQQSEEFIDQIKNDILTRALDTKYEYVFDDMLRLNKTTPEELQQNIPKIYPLMPDEALDVIIKAQKNRNFVTLIMGDMETGRSWGEINDIKGVIGSSRGANYSYPLLVSFDRQETDEESGETYGKDFDFLNYRTNGQIKEYLEDNFLNVDETLSDGGGIISENIVAIKVGFSDSSSPKYQHDNFHPAYDIKNSIIQKDEIEESTTVKNKRTGEENTTKIDKEIYSILAKEAKSGEMKIISRAESIEDIHQVLKTEYELALINPKKADIQKHLENEVGEEVKKKQNKAPKP